MHILDAYLRYICQRLIDPLAIIQEVDLDTETVFANFTVYDKVVIRNMIIVSPISCLVCLL